MDDAWKNCTSCKKAIAWGARYFKCSVSTCNSGRLQFAFCSVACWDAHVPAMSHRASVWAIEEKAPVRALGTTQERAPSSPAPGWRPVASPPAHPPEPERRIVRGPTPEREPDEVLIIASRLKDYVREQADFNTSADVMEVLSDIVRDATRDALHRARAEGRRTLMGRDFRR